MIIEFSVKNYRSFQSEQTLSWVASNYDKTLPANLISPDLPGMPDLRLVKAAALYGPNAGGKSNVVLALRFLRWLVVESATGQKPGAPLPAEPFRLDAVSVNQPTMLTLTFVAEKVRYELAVAVTRERVIQERLVAYPLGRAQVWYDRVWNAESRHYEWSPAQPTGFERDAGIVEKTRDNALFLSTAAQWNNAQVAPVFRWFAEKLQFLSLSAEGQLSNAFTAQMAHQSGPTREALEKLLRTADLGLTGFQVELEEPPADVRTFFDGVRSMIQAAGAPPEMLPGQFWKVTFEHEGKEGKRFPIGWGEESAGTRRFFSLLGPWLAVTQASQVVCVDELDTSLHPTLVAALLRLLFQSTQTRPGAQLLFTTHNPLLLDPTLMRRDQVWFADKKQDGESFLYPLTDYKPRPAESLVRGYLSGRYGAVPFIPHGLTGEKPAPEDQPASGKEAVHAG